eukprot:Rhum_TRINITY_DN22905_c0_g1::Rhum_TRINITY_DN22905_c0_g1_i1::g.176417::m.176417
MSTPSCTPLYVTPAARRLHECCGLPALENVKNAIAFSTLATQYVSLKAGLKAGKAVYCDKCRNAVWEQGVWQEEEKVEQVAWVQEEVLAKSESGSLTALAVLYDYGNSQLPSVRVSIQTAIWGTVLFEKLHAVMEKFHNKCASFDDDDAQKTLASILHDLLGIPEDERADYVVDNLDRQKPQLIQRKLQYRPMKRDEKGNLTKERDLSKTPKTGFSLLDGPNSGARFVLAFAKVRLTDDKKINVHIKFVAKQDVSTFATHYATTCDAKKKIFANAIELNVHEDGYVECKPTEEGNVLGLWTYLPETKKHLTSDNATTQLVLEPRDPHLVDRFMARQDPIKKIGVKLSRSTLIEGVRHVPCNEMTDAVTFEPAPYRLALAVLTSLKETEGFRCTVEKLRGLCDTEAAKLGVQWSKIIASTNCGIVTGQKDLAISVDALEALCEGRKLEDNVPLSSIWQNLTNYNHQAADTNLPGGVFPCVVIRYIWAQFSTSKRQRTGFLWTEERSMNDAHVAYVYLGSGGYSAFIEAEMKLKWKELTDEGVLTFTENDSSIFQSSETQVYTPLKNRLEKPTKDGLEFTRSPYTDTNGDIPYQFQKRKHVYMAGRLFTRLRVKKQPETPPSTIWLQPSHLKHISNHEVLELSDSGRSYVASLSVPCATASTVS